VRLTNLTALQSIDIQNAEIKKLFPHAMNVTIKREFIKDVNATSVDDVEALSLENYFLEHLKEESQTQEFERLKNKVQELFSAYEEAIDDTL
jgi:DnaJ-domain-containing protein 1